MSIILNDKNLSIIGTSHISSHSIEEIKNFVITENPDIIAVELDPQRLVSLLSDQKSKLKLSDIKYLGFSGFVFALIAGFAQKKLGNVVKLSPGADMKAGVLLAKERKLKLALIDQNIQVTLKKFSKAFTFKEKMKILWDVIEAVLFKKRAMKKMGIVNFDLTKVPEDELIEKMMIPIKTRYPNMYKVLISERNEIMATRLIKLSKKNVDKHILAIVGAGHKNEILRIFKKKYTSIEIL